MKFEKIKLNDLIHAEYNPRKTLKPGDDEYKKIKKSIEEFGYVEPIIINFDNTIIGGHQRATVLKDLGYDEADIIRIEIDKVKEKALNIALNKISGEWDEKKLEQVMKELQDEIDLIVTGFDESEIEAVLKEIDEIGVVEEDNFNEEPPTEPKAKPGEIYILGNHRLMCGDTTDLEQVKKLMNGIEADMVLTDPPYNVAIENAKGMTIKNDNMESGKFREFLTYCFKNMETNLKKGGAFYVWYASREHINFENALNKAEFKVRQQIIWNKNTFILGRQDYQWKHEPCLYGWKDGAAHYFIDDRAQSTLIEDNPLEINKLKKVEMQKLLEELLNERKSTTIINENKPSTNDLHPTMKPIKLLAKLIKNSSRIGESVLDVFGGSGSTLIACEQLNRKCYMMELDPGYVDVIINRWEQYTGKKAEKLEGA